GDQVARAGTDGVYAEHLAILLVRHDLDQAVGVSVGLRAAQRGKWELADDHVVARFARLLFSQANAGDLRMGEGGGGHGLIVHLLIVAGAPPVRPQALIRRPLAPAELADDGG